MRARTLAAVALLTSAIALVALPASVGSQEPTRTSGVLVGWQPIVAAPDGVATASRSIPLDPRHAAESRIDPDGRMVDPAGPLASVPTRPRAQVPRASLGVTPKAIPWRYDPEVSWYGPGFYGGRTACGQAYTTTLLGVAHRTLPCGTKVSFRNPKNGRTITVRVIDRGPYVEGRQWDLSGAACTALDHCSTGPLEWRFP